MEGIIDSLIKCSQRITEALETAKKYLLRRNQILDEKYGRKRGWSMIVEKQDRSRRLENMTLEEQLRYSEFTRDISRLVDQLNKHKDQLNNEFDDERKGNIRTYKGVDYVVQYVVKE
ncbi:uncharacterized protein LOC141632408 [Silene latifolia]|uniref:uncharacterized protein LOC141632408 n=1 Tax=Silene latifolia TaxID=37657 RepID=UPI003D779659